MHRIELLPELVRRLSGERGGRIHQVDAIDPLRTAHIIVDMQNGFLEPGAPVEIPVARDIVGNINAISAAIRKSGGLNIFLRFATSPDAPRDWPSFYRRITPAHGEAHKNAFMPGSHYWQLWPGLEVKPQDAVIDKLRFGAFVPGTCDLQDILTRRQVDTVIITGTATNCCCESTARDAMQLNYNVIFMTDANAAGSDAEHNATLNNLCAMFAELLGTEELLDLLGRSAGIDRAPAGDGA